MRKIVYLVTVSLDGFMEGPKGDLGWHRVDAELHAHLNDEIRGAGAFLEGRVMYELMAAYWPTADQAPGATDVEKEFARIWRETPKVVYSKTLQQAAWNATLVREFDPAAVRKLQAEPGGDMIVGGAVLASAFWSHDLIDEYRIYVDPVVIGEGRRPFPAGWAHIPLRLSETRSFGNGVVLLRYGRP
jgi:dihydrofolate reductase